MALDWEIAVIATTVQEILAYIFLLSTEERDPAFMLLPHQAFFLLLEKMEVSRTLVRSFQDA